VKINDISLESYRKLERERDELAGQIKQLEESNSGLALQLFNEHQKLRAERRCVHGIATQASCSICSAV